MGLLKNVENRRLDFYELDPTLHFCIYAANIDTSFSPVSNHMHHNAIEITFMSSGAQSFTINQTKYSLCGNQYLIVPPNIEHAFAEKTEKSHCFYISIDILNHKNDFAGLPKKESNVLYDMLTSLKTGIVSSYNATSDLTKILMEYANPSLLSITKIRNLFLSFVIKFLENLNNPNSTISLEIQAAIDYIENNLTENITLKQLSSISNLSQTTFINHFHRDIGFTPKEYISRKKIERAQELLSIKENTITDVASELCFETTQYFATVFKKYTSYTPTEWRNTNKPSAPKKASIRYRKTKVKC